MPAVYARILASTAGSTWDFAKWQPHAVVINLGTNDASTSGDPGTPYETAYLGFVRTLRQKYPDAHLLLTIGPMLDGANLTAIKGHLQKVITTRAGEGDTKMSFLEFPCSSRRTATAATGTRAPPPTPRWPPCSPPSSRLVSAGESLRVGFERRSSRHQHRCRRRGSNARGPCDIYQDAGQACVAAYSTVRH
jgi:hypothetical protein